MLNNPLVKKLVINIQQDFSTREKLFLSPEQVSTDLECEMGSIFRALKETIVENAMSQHFNARIDRSCSKNLLDYFVGVASSKQAETLASIGSDEDDDEEGQNLKKQLVLHKKQRLAQRRRRENSEDVDENVGLALQLENDNLQAMLADMKEEMKSLKAGQGEVQSLLATSQLKALPSSSSSSIVAVATSDLLKALSSSSSSSTAVPTSGVPVQQNVVLPVIVNKDMDVIVKKEKNLDGNIFVLLC